MIGDVLDQDVHYYVKVDFHGFEDFIDALGGVDVYVESGFVDPAYPTDDYLTRTVRFEEGWQHMDGDTALCLPVHAMARTVKDQILRAPNDSKKSSSR